jgi:hypothetical protein
MVVLYFCWLADSRLSRLTALIKTCVFNMVRRFSKVVLVGYSGLEVAVNELWRKLFNFYFVLVFK